MARVAQPSSKLRTAELLTNAFFRPLSESQIYRLMDEVVDWEEVIKLKVFETTNNLTPKPKVNLLLFDVKDVIVVADRAMMSEDNLQAMEEAKLKFTYVVAAKLKKLPKKLREEILERKEESQVQFGEESISVQEHDHEGRKLVVQYSEKRAQKDAKDRERLIDIHK